MRSQDPQRTDTYYATLPRTVRERFDPEGAAFFWIERRSDGSPWADVKARLRQLLADNPEVPGVAVVTNGRYRKFDRDLVPVEGGTGTVTVEIRLRDSSRHHKRITQAELNRRQRNDADQGLLMLRIFREAFPEAWAEGWPTFRQKRNAALARWAPKAAAARRGHPKGFAGIARVVAVPPPGAPWGVLPPPEGESWEDRPRSYRRDLGDLRRLLAAIEAEGGQVPGLGS